MSRRLHETKQNMQVHVIGIVCSSQWLCAGEGNALVEAVSTTASTPISTHTYMYQPALHLAVCQHCQQVGVPARYTAT